jgi:hypothetical protein
MNDEQTVDMSTPWHEAGALVLREHTNDDDNVSLAEPVAADYDLEAVDDSFVSFVTRYAQRLGHLPFGVVFQLADAWGIEPEGTHALCLSADPNMVLWPRCSSDFLANLIYLLQHDPEAITAHGAPKAVAAEGCLTPNALPEFDKRRYASNQPQTEVVWLPAVFCADLAGVALNSTMADASVPFGLSISLIDATTGQTVQELSLADLLGGNAGTPDHQA